MDINYNLFIIIKEIGTNNENTIKIKYDNNRYEEEIEKLIEEGEEYEENDQKEIEQIKNKFKIENYNKLLEEIEKLKIDNKDLKKENHNIKKE